MAEKRCGVHYPGHPHYALAITLALTVVVAPSVISQVREARANALIGDIEIIRNNLLKFFSDTQQMPILEDPRMINRSGVEKINGVEGLTSGIFLNDKSIISWQGPYIEREVLLNSFGGRYFPDYSTEVTTSQGERAVSAVLVVTGVSNGQVKIIDETVDDGDLQDGNIQITSRFGIGGFTSQMVVIILEDTIINPVTGIPIYERRRGITTFEPREEEEEGGL